MQEEKLKSTQNKTPEKIESETPEKIESETPEKTESETPEKIESERYNTSTLEAPSFLLYECHLIEALKSILQRPLFFHHYPFHPT